MGFLIFKSEDLYSLGLNVTEIRNIKNEASSNGFVLSGKGWLNSCKGGK